ncbi:MAG: site-specific integrase, partial [Patescibacteria group bacterium]
MSNTRLKTSITKQFNSQIKELKLGIAEKKRLFELFEDFIAWKHNFGAWSESEVDDFISTRRDKISPNLSQHLKNYIRHSSFDEIQVFLLEFLDNLAAKKTTKKTIRNYRSDIKQFIRSAKSTAVAKLLTREKLDKFVEAQVKKGLKSSSINRKLSSITRFAQFIEEELIVKNDLSWLTGHKYKPLQIKTSVKPSPFSGEGPLASAREGEATAGKVKTFGLTSLVPPTAGLEFLSTSGKRSNTTPGMTLDELPLTNLSTGEDFKKSRISHETLNSKAKITQAQAAQIKQLKKANFFKAAILSLVVLFLFSFQSMTDFANTQLTQTKTGNFISRTIENISQPWNWLTNKQNESDKNYLTQAKRGNILGAKEDLTKSKLLFHIPTNFNAAVEVLNLSIAETLDVTGDSDLGGDLTVDGDTTLAGDTSLQSNLQVDGDTNVDGNLTVAGTTVLTGDTTLNATTINGVLTLTQDISADGIDIDLGDGELTAGNVIYSLTAGTGITVTSDQTPTISVTSAANAANLEVWSTIDANGTELTAGSNDDTLELAVADNITITGSGDTITFGADNVFGWTDTGTTVSLLTATDKVGIGTASPTAQLQIGAGTPSNADGADDVYIAGDLEVATGIYVSDGGLVDFSNIAQDDTSPQGVKFPQNTSASLAAISGGGEGYLAWSTDGDKFQQFDGTNWTDLATGGSTEWTDAGTYLHPDETNDTLGVGGTTLAAADIVLGSDGSAIFNEQSNSVDFRIESNDQEAIFFVDGDTNRIGIGSTSPDDVLDVVGTIDISSGNTYQINNTDVLSSTTLGSSVVTSSLTTVGVLNSGSITSGFGNIDIGSSNLDADGTITFAGISDGLVKSTSGVLSAASEGTDYEGPLTFTNGLTESSQTVRWGGALTENTTITLDSTETLDFANTGTGNITYNLTSTGDFDIQDNGTSAFYVKDDGNVGIGTTTPQSLLHVGSTGTPGSIDGTDDLYVYDDLEVDGSIYGTVAGTLINTAADSGTSTLNHGDTLAINGDNSGIDSSLSGDTYTLSFDSTEVGDTTTWGSGSAFTWTFDSTGGTDPSITFGDNTISFNAADITTVSGNVDVEGYMAVGNGSGLSANSGLIVDYDTTYTNVGQQLLVLGTVTGASNQNI